MTSALYALRNGKKVLVLEGESLGGQIATSPRLENYPSIKEISGEVFADNLFEQITDLGAEVEIEKATRIEKLADKSFAVKTEYGEYSAKSVIIAAGVKHKHLKTKENREDLVGRGVYYCAVCDGPFYKGKEVAVIGDANTALQYALLLSGYCKKVYMYTLFDKFSATKPCKDIADEREHRSAAEYERRRVCRRKRIGSNRVYRQRRQPMPPRDPRRVRGDRAGAGQRGFCEPGRSGRRGLYHSGRKLQNAHGRLVRGGRLPHESGAAGIHRSRRRRGRGDERFAVPGKPVKAYILHNALPRAI